MTDGTSPRADYVIVGAGSAGSVLASRLSEDGGATVLVVEAGGSDRGPLIRMPGALSYPMNLARYDWGFVSEPEPHLNGRRLACPRGRVLGGSSSINGMVYVRGHPRDYDHWAQQGATGWSFRDVLPYFLRLEQWHQGGPFETGPADPAWRGRHGPLHVTRGQRADPLNRAFVEAGRQAGYPLNADCNGETQAGFGPFDRTVYRGRRWSAADAYLRPALKRRNLRLLRGFARRLVIEQGRAVGVEVQRRAGVEVIRASREVIVAASAVNSPRLLLLSGIGPASELAALGIDVRADRPGVGRNLQDHLEVYVQQACVLPVSLYRYWSGPGKVWAGLRWLLGRRGPGASNQFESGAFVSSSGDVAYPDVQLHFLPLAVRYDGRSAAPGHGFQVHVGPMRSPSRGAVSLRDGDPASPPRIAFGYMSNGQDWIDFRRCIRLARRIFAQPAFDPYRGAELSPGAAVGSDADIDAYVREHAESAYHPCGTCRMGRRDDPLAVVDSECRVIGVDALRVADSSIFPRITNGNLNAPSIMVGEKASDLVRGRAPPRCDLPV